MEEKEMSSTNLSEVFKILDLKEKLKRKEEEFFELYGQKIRISSKLKEKVELVCNIVRDRFGENYEWIGYLLGNNEYVALDFYLPYQIVSRAFVTEDKIYSSKVSKELEEYMKRTGLRLIGWIHSHGSLSPFHSSVDDQNTYGMVRFIGSHSKRVFLELDKAPKRIERIIPKGKDIILDGEKTAIIGKIVIPNELARVLFNRSILGKNVEKAVTNILSVLLSYMDWWFFKKRWLAPVYSIVTNANLEFYGEIWRYDSDKAPEKIAKGDIVEIIDIEYDVLWDKETLIEEVNKKVRLG